MVTAGPKGTITYQGGHSEVTCTWHISAPVTETIYLEFGNGFLFTDNLEFLEIYDGDVGGSAESTLTGSLDKRFSFISRSSDLYFVFSSVDGSGPGFEANYTFSSDPNECESFCSGRGHCLPSLVCDCAEGYEGDGCELEAPIVKEARLDESLGGLYVYFSFVSGQESMTDLAGLYGTFPCSELMSTDGMGMDPMCVWKTRGVLHARYGSGATIVPNDTFIIYGDKIGLFTEQGIESPSKMDETIVTLLGPETPVNPTILLQAPSVVTENFGFIVDSASGIVLVYMHRFHSYLTNIGQDTVMAVAFGTR